MLVNKTDLIGIGVAPATASRYINMLNRSCPSLTVKPEIPIRGQGRQPTKNFNLEYALKIAREYAFSTNEKCNTDEWRDLGEALDKVKKEKKPCKSN